MKFDLELSIRIAEKQASDIIKKYGIYQPDHIRLEDIAFDLGVTITEGSLAGASARLIRYGNHGTIRLPFTESNIARKRFSTAHELGHFVLNHRGYSLEIVCSEDDMMNWYKKDDETEANFFASELLMPESLVKKRCDVKKVSFEPVGKIAEDFRTSLTAAAIRFVRFCPEPCALVCSENYFAKWCYTSDDWKFFIPLKTKLDNRTLAADYFAGKEMYDKPLEIEAEAWIENRRVKEITEHSIALGHYGLVLTLLWLRP